MSTLTPGTLRADETRPHGAGRPATPPAPHRWRRTLPPLVFLAPFVVLFVITYLAPILYAVKESLFRLQRSGLGLEAPTTVFAGLGNYRTVLTDHDFLVSIARVILIGAVQVPVMLGLALILALLLDARRTPGKRFFRLAFFLPYAIPGIIGGLMWAFLYEPAVSPLAEGLHALGVGIDFTSDAWLPWSVGNMLTWAWTGYNMLVIHSALQTIPDELEEAAALDGCTGWRLAWHIKVPLVRPALVMTCVFSIIGTAQLYNEPVVMRAIAPNLPNDWTPIMAMQAEVAANNYSLAAAEAVVLALVIFVLSFGFLRLAGRKGAAL